MRGRPGRLLPDWRHEERRSPDGAFESAQRVTAPGFVVERSPAGARRLGRVYWAVVESATGGLVGAREGAHGVELRLLRYGPLLLRFGGPEAGAGEGRVWCRYPIAGGLLARRAGGEIAFSQTASPPYELCAEIRGFHPALAAGDGTQSWTDPLYTRLQSRLHVAISRRYFAALLRAGGERPPT
jgi:hypothetical protein